MTAHTPHGRRLDQLLADNQWHRWDHIIDDIVDHVPPGMAARTGDRERRRKLDDTNQSRTTGTADTDRRSGSRIIAAKSIYDRIRRGTAQRKTIGGLVWIRQTVSRRD